MIVHVFVQCTGSAYGTQSVRYFFIAVIGKLHTVQRLGDIQSGIHAMFRIVKLILLSVACPHGLNKCQRLVVLR